MSGIETFLWSGEDRIAGAVVVPNMASYRTHAAEHVLFSYSFKSLHAPQLQRIEAHGAR